MQKIDLSIVVAATPSGIIGNEGKLLWRLPSDLARFKKITVETGTMIMGRKTYDSILARNGKPLPGRKHIVLSRNNVAPSPFNDSVQFVGSLKEACKEVVKNGGRACVIGGGEIYKLFLPIPQVTKAYVTMVLAPELIGDTRFFPLPKNAGIWKRISFSDFRKRNPNDEYRTSFSVFERLQN
ncbi:MAG: dihydrofolate reductase [Candidatus Kaiserbacteria bacterium]|nr:dihydrofolate reductase [Candidatus Kaiserbacteria bacterium]